MRFGNNLLIIMAGGGGVVLKPVIHVTDCVLRNALVRMPRRFPLTTLRSRSGVSQYRSET
jgi:hypothetical protein